MKVRFKSLCAGPDGVFRVGQEAEVKEEFGLQLVSGGYADAIGAKAVAAVAVQEIKEAVKPSPKTTHRKG